MHGIVRMVAMLVLFSITAVLPEAQAMPVAAAPAGHAAGCHGHGPATPSPASTRYECCVNGHHAAVLSVPFSLRFVAVQVGCSDSGDAARPAFLFNANLAMLVFPSDSPPGSAPLRI